MELTPGMVTWTNAAGKPMGEKCLQKGWRGNAENVTNEFAQVNHYAIKSREDFLLKRLRGTANSKNKDRIDMEYWDEDETALAVLALLACVSHRSKCGDFGN